MADFGLGCGGDYSGGGVVMTDTKPNPGSTDARAQGCTCPVIDNHHGDGFERFGERLFWINDNCKLHGKKHD